ncbi:hypothetical protein PIB30_038914 [Stylosanthes scabra]|uniref:Uncharacterized protein n=1 Tax=Stylosanthes scabra TaxID=79078 RepID=A0ABU6QEX4_9FABA|nr:hypothetical protein [Stylosanthes scabra]
MPFTRCNSQIPVPPPSPIPTANGSRSAANAIFSEFLEKTLQLPELILPEPHFPPAPAEIDLRSLPMASADLVLRSAREFGAFRIRCHGIPANDLGTVVDEAEQIFQDSRNAVLERVGCGGEMIPFVRSRKGALEFTANKVLRNQTHRSFWVHMGNVASRLDSIVEQVSLALQQDESQEDFEERLEETESMICLCRYPHNKASKQNDAVSAGKKKDKCDYVLRFYLPMEHCIFYVQTERGPLSFDAGREHIVVTVGKQLQECSHGVFKCVPAAEMIFMPSFHSSSASFSIELTCTVSSNQRLNFSNKNLKIISLTDQILFILCLAFLYRFICFIYS